MCIRDRDDVLARIEADFAASGADHMEVKNAYSGGPIYNANLFISQYCAAKDKDFESISLNDLAATCLLYTSHAAP